MRCCGLTFRVEGIGWVMRECRDDVRLGMTRLLSPWSRVLGRPSPVRGRVKDEWAVRDGAMVAVEIVVVIGIRFEGGNSSKPVQLGVLALPIDGGGLVQQGQKRM